MVGGKRVQVGKKKAQLKSTASMQTPKQRHNEKAHKSVPGNYIYYIPNIINDHDSSSLIASNTRRIQAIRVPGNYINYISYN